MTESHVCTIVLSIEGSREVLESGTERVNLGFSPSGACACGKRWELCYLNSDDGVYAESGVPK